MIKTVGDNQKIDNYTYSVLVKMGKTQSKSANNGDAQVTVIQNQELHSEEHEQQSLMLWLILVVVIMQLVIKLYQMYKNREKKIALKAARSIAAINVV